MINVANKIKSLSLSNFFNNIHLLLKHNLKSIHLENRQELESKLFDLRNRLLYFELLRFFENEANSEFQCEISHIKELGQVTVFPYKQLKTLQNIEAGYDEVKKLPFVIHKYKRLYFPKTWNVEMAKYTYKKYIEVENILGGNYIEKAPHEYQSSTIRVKKGDIVFDIGAAEALFALDIIDLAMKVFILESERIWNEPLKATFEPYKDKVKIINKRISDIDSINEIRLETCLKDEDFESLFIKMDIEGYESRIIEGNKPLFSKNIDLRIACCTYHEQCDAVNINTLLSDFGYKTEFSEGYMLYIYDENLQPPYFRKGMVRAFRILQ